MYLKKLWNFVLKVFKKNQNKKWQFVKKYVYNIVFQSKNKDFDTYFEEK